VALLKQLGARVLLTTLRAWSVLRSWPQELGVQGTNRVFAPSESEDGRDQSSGASNSLCSSSPGVWATAIIGRSSLLTVRRNTSGRA
jgi:hypothetical protein